MLETVVKGSAVFELTKLPKRNGIEPTTPSTGSLFPRVSSFTLLGSAR